MNDAVLQEHLGFGQVRAWLKGQTQSEPGGLLAEQLQPLAELSAVEAALTEVDEALDLLRDNQSPGLGGCHDIRAVVAACQALGSLAPAPELRLVLQSVQVMEKCRLWFTGRQGQGALGGLAAGIVALPELRQRLQQAIGERGDILDSASARLGQLRYQGRQLRAQVKQRLERLLGDDRLTGCFQERLVTVRNDRYVVPVKSDSRGRVKGFVHDESASGQTLYVEPTLVLDDNNRLQQLGREEQREERRILLELADLVRRDQGPLLRNQRLLGRIDLRFAAARLSLAYRGCRPAFAEKPMVELRGVRHPLLMFDHGGFDPTVAIPVDLLLGEEDRALVISGSNTGGKSVALKTLGLALLMMRSGLHLPCHPDSRIYPFGRLFVDIGDDQSITDHLSTFSGHLLRLRRILAEADDDSLVLLDEAGSGTDPAEGAALMQAIVESLCVRGTKVVLTTHLGQLKQFAQVTPGVVNAAVAFDPETLEPTYELLYGIPGVSSALATARRLGLPEAVVQRAITTLGSRHDQNQLLVDLTRQQGELRVQLEQARHLRAEAQAVQQLRKNQLQQLKQRRKEILEKAQYQAQQLIAETEQHLRQLRKRKKTQDHPRQTVRDQQQLAAARDKLQPFAPKRRRLDAAPQDLKIGELVRVLPLNVEARVERLDQRQAELLIGGKRMRQPLTALQQFSPRRFAGSAPEVATVTRKSGERTLSHRLNLVGQRTDEALSRLERFLDDALLHQLAQVEIIHGAGEGILRRAVRDYLAGQRSVSAFYAAAIEQGGDNVTIAELGGS